MSNAFQQARIVFYCGNYQIETRYVYDDDMQPPSFWCQTGGTYTHFIDALRLLSTYSSGKIVLAETEIPFLNR